MRKLAFLFFTLSFLFTNCEKYTYTPPYSTPPAGYYDEVNSGVVYNGNLIVAGNFTSLLGSANGIAQWNGSSWQSLGSGLGGTYHSAGAFTIYNGNLIVAGNFTTAGGQTANNIAQWNGSLWQPLGNGITVGTIGTYPSINALTEYNGNLVAGGSFIVAGSNGIAEWNSSAWTSFGGGGLGGYGDLSINYLVTCKGILFASGGFDTIGGQYTGYGGFVKWNGSVWQPISLGKDGGVSEILECDSNLIALGAFDSIGGIQAKNAAEWNGASWTALSAFGDSYLESPVVYNNNIYFNNYVYNDSVIYQWNPSGSPTLFATCTTTKERWSEQGIQPSMHPLCVYHGNLIVGGWFTSVNGVNCSNNLAQWNGTNWIPF